MLEFDEIYDFEDMMGLMPSKMYSGHSYQKASKCRRTASKGAFGKSKLERGAL